jgi:D-alanyl-D-alanine carboxypeptidase/D-alanyl-D-alanine-endopeptidase (penicillin-binding protein 4)
MKVSQNQYAETFIKTIGAGSIARGHAIALEIFTSWGIPAASFILRDGSGLSRYDYVTTDALVAILAHLHGEARLRDAFDASLPIAAQDGTLANRFKGSAAATTGHLRAKTGSMSNVRALAGYVDSADGEPFAFAIIANNFETAADVVNRATDAIVSRVATFRR